MRGFSLRYFFENFVRFASLSLFYFDGNLHACFRLKALAGDKWRTREAKIQESTSYRNWLNASRCREQLWAPSEPLCLQSLLFSEREQVRFTFLHDGDPAEAVFFVFVASINNFHVCEIFVDRNHSSVLITVTVAVCWSFTIVISFKKNWKDNLPVMLLCHPHSASTFRATQTRST